MPAMEEEGSSKIVSLLSFCCEMIHLSSNPHPFPSILNPDWSLNGPPY